MPGTRIGRAIAGTVLVVFGLFGFLPVLGFWMIPLGLVFLSVDFPIMRRFRRKATLSIGRWVKLRAPNFWAKYVARVANGFAENEEDDKGA